MIPVEEQSSVSLPWGFSSEYADSETGVALRCNWRPSSAAIDGHLPAAARLTYECMLVSHPSGIRSFTGSRLPDHNYSFALVYFNYRYYSPSLGRWLSRDPAGEAASPNLYMMCENDCVNGRDALGLLDVLFAFDGTANLPEDFTNVKIMHDLYQRPTKYYYKGIGNKQDFPELINYAPRQWKGFGMNDYVRKAAYQLMDLYFDNPNECLNVDVIGFSRGAVTAVKFIDTIFNKPVFFHGYLQSEAMERRIKFRFLGLFDPVPGPSLYEELSGINIPKLVKRAYIAYSRHEQRKAFTPYYYERGDNLFAHYYWGGHSDVGGGYKERGLANIALREMIAQAFEAGAPFGAFIHADYFRNYPDFSESLLWHQQTQIYYWIGDIVWPFKCTRMHYMYSPMNNSIPRHPSMYFLRTLPLEEACLGAVGFLDNRLLHHERGAFF